MPYHRRSWYGRECYFTGMWEGNQLTDGVMSIEGIYYYAGQLLGGSPEGEGKFVIGDTTWIGTFESGELVEGVKTLSDGSIQKIPRPYF